MTTVETIREVAANAVEVGELLVRGRLYYNEDCSELQKTIRILKQIMEVIDNEHSRTEVI